MASGKELSRTVTCGMWKEHIKKHPSFLEVRMYDKEGRQISTDKVRANMFCHMRVLFKKLSDSEAKLVGALLQLIASTSGEQMGLGINQDYGFTEIIIS